MIVPPNAGISVTTPPEEARLDWYREDPLANDHHHHWHVVYPGDGPPTPPGAPPRTQRRQGELFFYMHQQMLARYDTERTIAGLELCKPLDEYDGAIPEGYELEGYDPRPSGAQITGNRLTALQNGHDEAGSALAAGKIDRLDGGESVPLGENVLGCIVESSDWYESPTAAARAALSYSNFHGVGHVAIAEAAQPGGVFRGPMSYFETAIRDPVFYRWHRHIDELYADCQRRAGEANLGEFAADVAFRGDGSLDIELCLASDIPGAEEPGFDFAAWGSEELGVDLDQGGPVRDELLTGFAISNLALATPGSPQIPDAWLQNVVHLTHEPFVFFIRVTNQRPEPQEVTARIFLAHAELAGDRRQWIELDKFHATLEPGANLLARPDARSSVVKRKGLDAPGAEPQAVDGADVWCDCGWPYSLLLPSGESTPEGTPFKLLVAFTDWAQDQVGEPDTCGSMSFCGARGEYPDARRMGYPFDRPFADSVEDALAVAPGMAMRDLRIRCTTQRPQGA